MFSYANFKGYHEIYHYIYTKIRFIIYITTEWFNMDLPNTVKYTGCPMGGVVLI